MSPGALTGVPTSLLYGRPCEGGFGALPWVEHITARHACAGGRLIVGGFSAHQTCFRVAVQVLRLTHMFLTPLCLLCRDIPKDMGKIPNGPLLRMYKGLRALPQVMDVCITPLTVKSAYCPNECTTPHL